MKWLNTSGTRDLPKYLITIGHLMEKGYPIDSALSFLKHYVKDVTQNKISDVQHELRNGKSVHEAFSYLDVPSDIRSFLYFYEMRGEIGVGFIQAGTAYEKKEKIKIEFRKVFRYPILLAWLCVMVVILMHQFIVPHFQLLFASLTSNPPLLTRIVFSFLDFFPLITVILSGGCFAVFLYYYFAIKKWHPTRKVEILLTIPFCKGITKRLMTYYFSLQFGQLLAAGLSLQHALSIFEEQEYLKFFQLEAGKMNNELNGGEPLHEVIKSCSYFVSQLSFVIENGERTGYLAEDLQYYSSILFQELEGTIHKGMSWLQPIFFLFMGATVFILFLSIMLPMFQMLGTLQ
ncbi:competence type IV pilus assembly protein ComGB [Bacillus solitudinis]|uniref:competence type IV pilus assembly protein ComGB n=1 Tax=Bacillus solitudinis TaxID=2014074 RepID=UPI000C24B39C|nr:competence type IV pilus assembly protein ComGB [Bacillus solitudinis]